MTRSTERTQLAGSPGPASRTSATSATVTEPRRRHRRQSSALRQQERYGFLFVSPSIILFAIFMVIPVVMALFLGFTDYSVIGDTQWVGLDNFRSMINDPFFAKAMSNTVIYAVMYVPAGLCVALGTALLLNARRAGVRLFRTFFYIPVISSTVATATMWYWLLNPSQGVFNKALALVGIDGPAWLYNSQWAMTAIVMMSVWSTFGTNMVLFLAGLQNIPGDLYEAATLDGAGAFARFWHVTLPGLSRTTFFVVTLLIISAFQVFDQAYVLTQGGPGNSTLTIVYYIYNQGFGGLKMGYASAMSFALTLVILVFTIINNAVSSRRES